MSGTSTTGTAAPGTATARRWRTPRQRGLWVAFVALLLGYSGWLADQLAANPNGPALCDWFTFAWAGAMTALWLVAELTKPPPAPGSKQAQRLVGMTRARRAWNLVQELLLLQLLLFGGALAINGLFMLWFRSMPH